MYRYRCAQCATTSPTVGTLAAARGERARHRADFHGGHIPDGEQLLRARRTPDRADARALLWLPAAAAALPILEWLARHLG